MKRIFVFLWLLFLSSGKLLLAQSACDSLYIPRGTMYLPERRELCQNDTLILQGISPDGNHQIRWFRNNQEIAGETQDILNVTEQGTYTIRYFNQGCYSASFDSIRIRFRNQPRPRSRELLLQQAAVTAGSVFTLQVQSIGNPASASFSWFRNDMLEPGSGPGLTGRNTGRYRVRTDSAGCFSYSNELIIRPSGSFIPQLCLSEPSGANGLRIEWGNAGNSSVQQYRIYQKRYYESVFSLIDSADASATFWVNDSIKYNSSFDVMITALVNGPGGIYESEPSPVNQTIFLKTESAPAGSPAANIVKWNAYNGFVVNKYFLFRNDILIDSLPGNQTVYQDFQGQSQSVYRIEAMYSTDGSGNFPQPGTITGKPVQCKGVMGQNYRIDPVEGVTAYAWTLPPGWIVMQGEGTNSITVSLNDTAQSGVIGVSLIYNCFTGNPSVLDVAVNQGYAFYDTLNVSACSTYNWNGQNYTQSGIYLYNGTTASGCDSVLTLNLTIRQPSSHSFSVKIKEGESYSFNGQILFLPGQYSDTLLNSAGCDSLVTLFLQYCGDTAFTEFFRFAVSNGESISKYADFNSDGKIDLITINNSRMSRFYSNTGSGFELTSSLQLPPFGHINAIADFDNDGRLDVLSNSEDGMTCLNNLIRIYWNSGPAAGYFSTTDFTELPLPANDFCIRSSEIDFNADGLKDVIATNMSGPSRTYRNNGNRIFTLQNDFAWPRDLWNSPGDFNGDGNADYLCLAKGAWADNLYGCYYYRGMGNGQFEPAVINFSTPPVASGGITINVDPLQNYVKDIIVYREGEQNPYIGKWNNSQFAFTTLSIPVGYRISQPFDLNLDGIEDLILTNPNGTDSIAYSPGDGNGGFGELKNILKKPGYSFSGFFSDAGVRYLSSYKSDSIIIFSKSSENRNIISASICSGESYFFNGVSLTEAGTYSDTLTGSTCDSIVHLKLTVRNAAPLQPLISGPASVCPLESGIAYTGSGVGNADAWNWVFPAGWTINSGQGSSTVIVTSGISGQSGAITLNAENSCGSSPQAILPADIVNCISDIDGNSYGVVQIGTQNWMMENLKVGRFRNGDTLANNLSDLDWEAAVSGAYSVYSGQNANDVAYGKLYNWYAVADSRGLCPSGWHVPTDAEWKTLETSLGMLAGELNNTGGRGVNQNVGGKLKSVSAQWLGTNTGATNESSFEALPGGYRYFDGSYLFKSNSGYWWTSSENSSSSAWYRNLKSSNAGSFRSNDFKTVGNSVRCIQD